MVWYTIQYTSFWNKSRNVWFTKYSKLPVGTLVTSIHTVHYSCVSFDAGVVDSEDIPLNLSRELLQDSALIRSVSVINTQGTYQHHMTFITRSYDIGIHFVWIGAYSYWLTLTYGSPVLWPGPASEIIWRHASRLVLFLHQLLSSHVLRCFLTTSLHLILGLPLGVNQGLCWKGPSWGVLESSMCVTCPSHLSLCLRRLSYTVGCLHLSWIWTFGTRTGMEIPKMLVRQWFWNTSGRFIWQVVKAHASPP